MMEVSVPKLRTDIEIVPTQYRGDRAVLVKDSLGIIKNPVLLRGEILEFLSLIDGKKNIQDIQLELIRRKRGLLVSSDEVRRLVTELDSAFLLESAHYRQEKDKIISEYSRLDVREAFLSGRSYPDSEEEIRAYIESLLALEKDVPSDIKGKNIAALVAPHIDLEVGKKVYAKAYEVLGETSPERIVLLGTGHNIQECFLSLTEKDFETPLGDVRTDKEFVRELKKAGNDVISPSDIAHRSEHSLEFQLLFLQYLFGSEFLLIPILCGSFHHVLNSCSRPSEIPGMSDFLNALRHYIEEDVSDTLIVAGVDFSHIGPKFGHSQQASYLLTEAKNHDSLMIEAFCKGDVVEFWSETKRVQNRYNVCGFPAMACLLEILPGAKGHLLAYDFWEEEPTQSAVSFAAIAIQKT